MRDLEWERLARVNRRTLLRGGAVTGAGLAAAALIGCGGDDDEDEPAGPTSTSTGAASSDADEYINGDLLVYNREDRPYPYVIPEKRQDPQPGGTLVLGNDQDFAQFDPAMSTSGTVTTHPSMGYDRLLSFVDGPNLHPHKVPELTPKLALSWETAPDGLTYTFRLTDKAKYHNKPPLNGRMLVANDVKLVLDRYATEGVHRANYTFMDRVEAPDDLTLRIVMKEPNPDFLVPLGSRYQPIYPMELVDQGLINNEVIGTGPFIMEEASKSLRVVHVKNPEYWGGPAYLDRVEFRIMPDQAARMAGFRAGQLHWAGSATLLANYAAAEALVSSKPDTQMYLGDDGAPTYGLALNLKNPKFQDERVRQALMMAIDRNRMSQILYQGFAEQLPTAPWFFVFDEQPTPDSGVFGQWWNADPTEAKRLLSAAGAENLEFELLWSQVEEQEQFLVDAFKQVGVTANPTKVDFTTFAATWNKIEYADTALGYSTGGFTADSRFRSQLTTGDPINRWNISDPEIDAWGKEQATELDPRARRETLRKIWDKVLDKAYRVDTILPLKFVALAPGLRNFRSDSPLASESGILGFGSWAPKVWLEK